MKKYLILVVILISTTAYSQDRIDPASVIGGFNPQSIFNFNADSLHFIKGWNWSSESNKLDDALLMNFNHTGRLPDSDNDLHYLYSNGQNWILAINEIAGGDRMASITQAQATQFEPSLTVDESDNFTPMNGDNTGAVFGFQYKNPDFLDDQNLSHNFVLRDSVLNSLQQDTATVLANPWADDELKEIVDMDGNGVNESEQHMPFNGYQWYFTLRIKPLEQIDASNADSTVLTIRMPYKTLSISGGDSTWDDGFIAFDEIPVTGLGANDTASIYSVRTTPEYLGKTRNLQTLTTDRTRFFLKANMLRTEVVDNNQEYITLSAFFQCDPVHSPNPYLQDKEDKGVNSGVGDRITNLGIQIIYNGNVDVAIDWIRIETPQYQNLARGQFDQEIIDTIQNRIETLFFYRPDIKIWRFYGIDEFWASNWMSQRYLNKLLGGNVTSELDHSGIQAGRMLHATDFKEFWKGQTVSGQFNREIAAPFIRRTDENIGGSQSLMDLNETIGLRRGYWGREHWNPSIWIKHDSLNSHYDSFIHRNPFDSISSGEILWQLMKSEDIHELEYGDNTAYNYVFDSPLMIIEHNLYKEYYKLNSVLFNDKSFIPNIWLANSWDLNNGEFVYEKRPLTGEELRYSFSSNILLGAKGLISYYGATGYNDNVASVWHNGGSGLSGLKTKTDDELLQSDLPTSWDLLYGDEIGGDFIGDPDITEVPDTGNILRSLDYYIKPNIIVWDSLGITENRVYIGRSSLRVETGKINRWIAEVEDELLNLELQAWKAKGFKQWYCQHPDLSSNYLQNFISPDSTDWKTRPIGRSISNGPGDDGWRPYYEHWDSAFFDLTLLKPKYSITTDTFYIGLQNRRTDPLIFFRDSSYSPPRNYMMFLSTAEMDELCRYGGINPYSSGASTSYTAERWQQYWWKRLGCREFTIPFNYKNMNDTNEYCLLRISELGGNLYDPLIPDEWWWRAPKFNDYKDTIIAQDGNFCVKMQPGEGKIFRVEVIHPDTTAGYLDYSNQSKLIAHAVLRDDGSESDSVRYHMTYYKEISPSSSTIGVYYRRSNVVSGNSTNDNIIWESDIYLSRNINIFCLTGESVVVNMDYCDHPSIVVRKKDDTTLWAYVVYDCIDYYTPQPYGYIVESIIDVSDETLISYNDLISTHSIGTFHGKNPDSPLQILDWGNPVINASANGNYYAWSDSLMVDVPSGGIVAGYRSLDAPPNYCLDNTTRIMWSDGSSTKHPSVNVYSDISNGVNDCSLVWQEKDGSQNPRDLTVIYLTRLKYDVTNDTLIYDFPKNPMSSGWNFELKPSDSSMAIISSNYEGNKSFPVILRRLIYNNFNYIYWQAGNGTWIEGIDVRLDSSSYYRYVYKFLYGDNLILQQPNIAQGPLSDLFWIGDQFWSRTPFVSMNLMLNNNIYLAGRTHSHITYSDKLDHNNYLYHISSGQQPHQASNNVIPQFDEAWKNRRVFNSLSGTPPKINTSAKYYYRQNENDLICEGFVGFSKYLLNYYVGIALIDDYTLPWNLPYELIKDSVNGNYYEQFDTDTIKTSTFNVAPMSTTDIDFVLYGSCSSSITIGLEGHPSNTFISLPIPILTPPDKGILLQYTLINMLDAEYNVVFINHDTTAKYTEKLFIGGLPIADTLIAKRTENYEGRIIIDLETGQTRKLTEAGNMELKVFPNPAKDEVFVTVNYPVKYLLENSDRINKAKIKFYSLTGEKLFEYLARPGETIKIPTSEYTQGLYFIQAEENIDKWQLDYLAPAVERVFIER